MRVLYVYPQNDWGFILIAMLERKMNFFPQDEKNWLLPHVGFCLRLDHNITETCMKLKFFPIGQKVFFHLGKYLDTSQ